MSNLLGRVMRHMETLAPLSLADRSWDNVGLLVEAPFARPNANRVMLTIDLTERVLDEAMADPAVGVIVAYHPPLFRPVKCLTLSDIHQRIALKCCAAGISVFSPHTALDACQNGINDWLVSGLGSGTSTPIVPTMPGTNAVTGMGRLLELTQPVSLDKLVDNVKKHLRLDKVRVARSRAPSKMIKSVAVCAGSGSSVLRGVPADVYLTGEMGHHEVLAAIASNTHVILCEHTNTERGYLAHKLQPYLEEQLGKDNADSTAVSVVCSNADKDPLNIE